MIRGGGRDNFQILLRSSRGSDGKREKAVRDVIPETIRRGEFET